MPNSSMSWKDLLCLLRHSAIPLNVYRCIPEAVRAILQCHKLVDLLTRSLEDRPDILAFCRRYASPLYTTHSRHRLRRRAWNSPVFSFEHEPLLSEYGGRDYHRSTQTLCRRRSPRRSEYPFYEEGFELPDELEAFDE